jgi:hypothetical protein
MIYVLNRNYGARLLTAQMTEPKWLNLQPHQRCLFAIRQPMWIRKTNKRVIQKSYTRHNGIGVKWIRVMKTGWPIKWHHCCIWPMKSHQSRSPLPLPWRPSLWWGHGACVWLDNPIICHFKGQRCHWDQPLAQSSIYHTRQSLWVSYQNIIWNLLKLNRNVTHLVKIQFVMV